MGAYSIIKETVFTGSTGRELRRHPAEVREVQFWLLAGPGRDPFGIFIFEPDTVAPQIGRPAKKIREALQTLIDLSFCKWDELTQYVWVIEMAHHQFQTPLKATDFRCRTAQKWYAAMPRNPFMGEWFDRYVVDFHLEKGEGAVERRVWIPRDGASHGASMPLVLSDSALSESSTREEPQTGLFGQPRALVPARDPNGPLTGGALDAAFETVWQAYPKALERKECRAQFGRLKPAPALVAQMLAAIEAQKRGEQWGRGFIPKLSNWLKDHRWLDKVAPAGGEAPRITERNAQSIGAAQRFAERRRQGGQQ